MRKDWVLLSVLGLMFVVGLGLVGFLKLSKKDISSNPVPSSEVSSEVAGTSVANKPYFSEDASVMMFYSDWCHWCKKQEDEVLAPLASEGYKVKPMNVGEKPELGTQYKVTGTPTFIAANGDQLVGFQDKDKLKAFLDSHK